MTPQGAIRDWRQRWERIKTEAEELNKPQRILMSGEAIKAARDRLLSFFVLAYHLKDALKEESRIGDEIVERAITHDLDFSLLADLANLDKHGRLRKSPRSGVVPTIGAASGVQDGAGQDGWKLSMMIHHGPRTRDGLTFASSVLEAWRRHLSGWGLL